MHRVTAIGSGAPAMQPHNGAVITTHGKRSRKCRVQSRALRGDLHFNNA